MFATIDTAMDTSAAMRLGRAAMSPSGYATETMAWANAEGLITGVTNTTLRPAGSAVRAQAATILMRLCENVLA